MPGSMAHQFSREAALTSFPTWHKKDAAYRRHFGQGTATVFSRTNVFLLSGARAAAEAIPSFGERVRRFLGTGDRPLGKAARHHDGLISFLALMEQTRGLTMMS